MPKCRLTVNGRVIEAQIGETLLEAALRGRMIIPQDCCTGQCSTCRVSVTAGSVDDVGTRVNNTVLSCCSLLEGDASITYDEVPALVKRAGEVIAIRNISPEIYELQVQLSEALTYLPGQYVNLSFSGFPGRDYSPTVLENGTQDPHLLVFHIKRYENGLVSSAIGSNIRVGLKVRVQGPYGHAFYRKNQGRLVLIASGTGWAPIWSVAQAAINAEPTREMIIITGARNATNLYMGNSLLWLAERGVREITLCASGTGFGGMVKKGRPTDFIPDLQINDVIYAAGAPAMVKSVETLASSKGITVYADPFTPASTGLSIMNRIKQMMNGQMFNPLSPRVKGAIYAGKAQSLPTPKTTVIRPHVEERARQSR
jgi:naphthalene 1,2-dioxygenase ferredoxin reductase component